MSTIVRIEITHHRLPLDPPFPAVVGPPAPHPLPGDDRARDTTTPAASGIGSGDAMYGFADYASYFIGQDPLDLERHHAVLSNIEFHAGRPWPLDVALWDLAGQIRGSPSGSCSADGAIAVRAYASSGVHRPVDDMVEVAERAVARGLPGAEGALRACRARRRPGVVTAVRDAVGDRLELMVDCNQGWRMPWDTQAPWDVGEGDRGGGACWRPSGVYWMEEPLHRGDYAGHAELRRRVPRADRRRRDDA